MIVWHSLPLKNVLIAIDLGDIKDYFAIDNQKKEKYLINYWFFIAYDKVIAKPLQKGSGLDQLEKFCGYKFGYTYYSTCSNKRLKGKQRALCWIKVVWVQQYMFTHLQSVFSSIKNWNAMLVPFSTFICEPVSFCLKKPVRE